MMKYIRFRNTIREVKFEDENVFAYYGSSKDDFYLANKKDVDIAADDLSDLLDKVVIITTPPLNMMISHEFWNDKRTAIEVFDEDQRKDKFSRDFSRCMGAVWADDGLRYVAEYKDGRWELL